jgi:hypothetical protein
LERNLVSEFKLPDVGEGLTEAEIVSWKVKVGDTVAINDVIVEIETAKSLVELPSPYAGQVLALLVAEGRWSRWARRSFRSATRPLLRWWRSVRRTRHETRRFLTRSTCPTPPRPGAARVSLWSAG